MYVDVDPLTDAPPDPRTPPEAGQEVAALYETHALGLVKLAKIMLGDQSALPARLRFRPLLSWPKAQRAARIADVGANGWNHDRVPLRRPTTRGDHVHNRRAMSES